MGLGAYAVSPMAASLSDCNSDACMHAQQQVSWLVSSLATFRRFQASIVGAVVTLFAPVAALITFA